ncbi:MAG: phosphatidate cytidylyltransferase [Alphaproteobacteria bacterium]|nr:phosphatidate cytidylyltransferase [Alphaproteobacteria bacterium]
MALPASDRPRGGLLPRIASAAVLAPAALAIVYFGTPLFEIALAAVAGILSWEWTRLCQSRRPSLLAALMTAVAVAAIVAVAMGHYALAAIAVSAGAIACLAIEGGERSRWMMAGALYVAAPLAAFEWIRVASPAGRDLALWLLVVIWASDTFAYVLGTTLGGPKLAPAISPKKTWAGLLGAVIGAGVAGALMAKMQGAGGVIAVAAVAGILGALGQGGDLLESAVKRHFNVKDASQIIPGHGGLMDRVDALMAAVVGVALARLTGWHGGAAW